MKKLLLLFMLCAGSFFSFVRADEDETETNAEPFSLIQEVSEDVKKGYGDDFIEDDEVEDSQESKEDVIESIKEEQENEEEQEDEDDDE